MKEALVVPLVNVPACNATQQEQCPSLLTKGSNDCCDWTAAAAVTHCVVISAQRALNAGCSCKLTLQHKTTKVPDHIDVTNAKTTVRCTYCCTYMHQPDTLHAIGVAQPGTSH